MTRSESRFSYRPRTELRSSDGWSIQHISATSSIMLYTYARNSCVHTASDSSQCRLLPQCLLLVKRVARCDFLPIFAQRPCGPPLARQRHAVHDAPSPGARISCGEDTMQQLPVVPD